MPESNQTPAVPFSNSKKAKIYYEHGKDALGLAVAVANMQEEKLLRKAERHHQPQAGASRKDRDQSSHRRDRLEEAKRMIVKRRAEAKKNKARTRKESQCRLQRRDDANMTALEDSTSTAPRKRVSFA